MPQHIGDIRHPLADEDVLRALRLAFLALLAGSARAALASRATHRRGLAIGLKNDLAQVADLVPYRVRSNADSGF